MILHPSVVEDAAAVVAEDVAEVDTVDGKEAEYDGDPVDET